MDNSGPSLVKIPAKVFLTCTGCKFLEKTPGLRDRKMITPIFCPFKKK